MPTGAGSHSAEEMDSLAEAVPRIDIATGAAQPIVGRDRESVVMYQMSTKEDLFTDVQAFKFFIGTYNVNGQRPEPNLQDWLAGWIMKLPKPFLNPLIFSSGRRAS